MDEPRLDGAMKRIEHALARIEAAASRKQAGSASEADQVLRTQVAETIAELDRLIGQLER